MSKIILDNILSGFNLSKINANFTKIMNALNNNVLWSTLPTGETNTVNNDLDMNGKRIYNLPTPVSDNEPVRVIDIRNSNTIQGITASTISVAPTANISSTNVQAALQEIYTDFGATNGAYSIGYGSTNIGLFADGIQLNQYSDLRAFTGNNKAVFICGYNGTSYNTGIAGWFTYDPTDTTSTDNDGTIIVTASGKRYKRAGITDEYLSSWFGTVGNRIANDLPALNKAIAAAPLGGVVKIVGMCKITSGIVINRRVGLICDTAADAIVVAATTGSNGVTYDNGVNGIQNIRLKLNVYGGANCCNIAVLLNRVDRSEDVQLNVYAGAASYGVALNGCLINNFKINSSVNFQPPVTAGTFAFQRHHVYMSKIYGVSTNANNIWVNLEGGGIGLYSDPNMSGEANNKYSGCIEGLATDTPIYLNGAQNAHLTNMHLEANSYPSNFINCGTLLIDSVLNPNGSADQGFYFQNCSGVTLNSYFGEYHFDSLCSRVTIGETKSNDAKKKPQPSYYNSLESSGKSGNIYGADSTTGEDGTYTIENLFNNPYMDVWSNGGSAAPDGWYAGGATLQKSVYPSPVYVNNNGEGSALYIQTTSAAYGTAPFAVLNSPYRQFSKDNFLSAFTAIYVPAGQPDVVVLGFSGTSTSYYVIGVVTEKNQWVDVRGSWKCPAGTPNTGAGIMVAPWNSTTSTIIAAGQFYVGGLNIVLGTKCPKHLADHGRRQSNIAPNISYPPSFFGQHAFVAGTGKWYLAKGTSSTADWVLLN